MKKYFLILLLLTFFFPVTTFAVSDGITAQQTLYKSPYFSNITWSNPQVATDTGIFTTTINLKSKTKKVQIFLDDVLMKTCVKKISCTVNFKKFSEEGVHEYSFLLTDIKGKTEEQKGTFEVINDAEVIPVTFTANGLNIPTGKSLSLLSKMKEKKNIFEMGLNLGGPDFGSDEDYRITAKQTYSNGLLEGPYTDEDVGDRIYTFLVIDKNGTEYRTNGSVKVK